MKYRSPATVATLSILTLGLYDLYWFGQTRNELAKVTQAKLKSNSWLLLIGALRAIALVSLIGAVFILIDTRQPVVVSQECQQQYTLNLLPKTRHIEPYTAACQKQIADRDTQNAEFGRFFPLAGIALVTGILGNTILLPRWLNPYVVAAQSVTHEAVNASNSMLLLLLYETRGIVLLQVGYNNPSAIPSFIGKDPLPALQQSLPHFDNNNPILKRILATIAIFMIVGLLLFIGMIVLLSHF